MTSKNQNDVKIEVVPITDLQPDPRNVNKGTERGYYMLTDSIQQRGAARSVWATSDGIIKAGNKTHQAAVDSGIEDVILVHTDGTKLVAVVRDDLVQGDPIADKLALEDNRIGEVSLEYDLPMLAQLAQDDDTLLDGLFYDEELAKLLEGLSEELPADPGPQLDKADELQEKWGVELGDLWEIGGHCLVCGDCTDAAVVERLMGGERANLCLTDPPYGIGVDYGENTKDEPTAIISLVDAFLPIALDVSDVALITSGRTVAWSYPIPSWVLVWCEPAGIKLGPWGFICSQLVLAYGKDPYLARGLGGRPDTFVGKGEGASSDGHPVAKPLGIWKWLVERGTVEKNTVVFDGFVGSGTTLVACEQLNRRGRGIEIEPRYCSVTLERLSQMGLEPRKL